MENSIEIPLKFVIGEICWVYEIPTDRKVFPYSLNSIHEVEITEIRGTDMEVKLTGRSVDGLEITQNQKFFFRTLREAIQFVENAKEYGEGFNYFFEGTYMERLRYDFRIKSKEEYNSTSGIRTISYNNDEVFINGSKMSKPFDEVLYIEEVN